MSFTLITADDPRSRFTTTFTTGGKELTFDVPRMDFIEDSVFADFQKWGKKNTDENLVARGIRPIAAAFDFLMDALKPTDYEQFKKLSFGEKQQLWVEWNRLSMVDLGESSDSDAG